MIEDKLEKLLNSKFEEEGFEDCFLIEIKGSGSGGKIEVYIDADAGLTLERCQKLSRYLENHIDENQWLGSKYVLEVSSPGLDRPLVFNRQFVKNIGRTLIIKLKNGTNLEGQLKEVKEDAFQIYIAPTKKIKEAQEIWVNFEEMEYSKIKISF